MARDTNDPTHGSADRTKARADWPYWPAEGGGVVMSNITSTNETSHHRASQRGDEPNVISIAEQLAAEFRPLAAELDRTGGFPHANYQRMREAGYLRALVPTELGGLGAGLAAMSRAQQALARGCASTALAVNMHHFQIGFLADGWRNDAPVEAILGRVADDGIVLGSTGAEAIVAGDWTTPTTARRDGDGYRISGRKFFCSQAPGMDLVRVNARDAETGEILVVSVPVPSDGLSVVETWDTTGMRATASHDLVLDEVWVPLRAVGLRVPVGAPCKHPAIAGVGYWFLTLLSGVYLGIAQEARAEGYKAIGGGRNSSFRAEPLTDVIIGQMEAEYVTAVAVRDHVVARLDVDRSDAQAALAQAILCKEIVTTHAANVVDHAVALAGGRAYFRKAPLERLARDMRAARFHPPASPTSFQMVGERMHASSG
jgi:alkylation response protein AidB-like acyl-CoA dehydrogenase